MAKTTIDELLNAVETVRILKETVAKHDRAIERVLDKLDLMERRLVALEAGAARA